MLVIDYSCGIKLSTATAFSAAINSAVKQGILIKGGAYIEQMSEANTVLLDKTGTITEGRPKVVSTQVLCDEMDEKQVLALAMAAGILLCPEDRKKEGGKEDGFAVCHV